MFGTVNLFVNTSRFTPAIILFVFLSACSSETKKSDECYYDRVDTMAEVIELKPHPDGGGRISVIMDFKGSKLAFEPQELGTLKGYHIDHDFLMRNHIEMGNKYEVVVSSITSGDCIPMFVSFNHSFE